MRLRAYALGIVTTAVVIVFALAESATEKYVSDHSRLAGTAIEIGIIVLAALAFRPLHQRVERFVEAAFTKRRREAREALHHLRKELTSFPNAEHVLRRVVEAVDRHMSSAASAVYLHRDNYVAEASSFEIPLEHVAKNDPLVVRLRSVAAPSDPRTLRSAIAGELAFPMMAGGALVGLLALTPKRIEYDDEDRHALAMLTESAGLALLALDPQLRPYDGPSSNLPRLLTSFVSREHEVSDLTALLREHPLVTLVGAGGVGKTRCALEVATNLTETSPDGAWLIELAQIADATLVAATIAQSLGVPLSASRPPLDTIVGYLKRKQLLLVLDNCEHVIDEARTVATAILHACPNVRVLATSREALRVAGEEIYRMPSLELAGAVRLFSDRGLSVDKRFTLTDANVPHVEEICRRLDGIPLAIELAAARVNVLPPAQLVKRLDERFRVLTGGDRSALPRHQTMRALIDWSYDLLAYEERRVFRSLSVFAGGCTLQSAAIVCGEDEIALLDRLSSLVDKSLVLAEPENAGMRYRLLESMRQYARERLVEHGEEAAVARAHAGAYLALAEELDRRWETTPDPQWDALVEPELENWRAALTWAFGARGDVTVGQRLAGILRRVWHAFAPAEGRHWVRVAAQTVDAGTDAAITANLDYAEAALDGALNRHKASYDAAERALERFRRLGDTRGEVLAQTRAGFALLFLGRVAEGEAGLQAALAGAEGLKLQKWTAAVLAYLALVPLFAGDFEKSRVQNIKALAAARTSGYDRHAAEIALNLAETEFRSGDAEAALRLSAEALDAYRFQRDSARIANCLLNMVAYLIALDRYDDARLQARKALTLSRDAQAEISVAVIVQHLATVAGLRPTSGAPSCEDRFRAARLLGYADARLAALEVVREYTEQQEHDKLLPALRDAIGEPELTTLMGEGSAWSEDRAVAEALLV